MSLETLVGFSAVGNNDILFIPAAAPTRATLHPPHHNTCLSICDRVAHQLNSVCLLYMCAEKPASVDLAVQTRATVADAATVRSCVHRMTTSPAAITIWCLVPAVATLVSASSRLASSVLFSPSLPSDTCSLR
jgi:hypothetical protein